jgi:hypothetical protein
VERLHTIRTTSKIKRCRSTIFYVLERNSRKLIIWKQVACMCCFFPRHVPAAAQCKYLAISTSLPRVILLMRQRSLDNKWQNAEICVTLDCVDFAVLVYLLWCNVSESHLFARLCRCVGGIFSVSWTTCGRAPKQALQQHWIGAATGEVGKTETEEQMGHDVLSMPFVAPCQ